MASLPSSFSFLFFFFFFFVCHLKFMVESSDPLVPAIYVFGDSLVDAGNNNYLNTLAKANFPHNGIDFPHHLPTGRFCNGKNVPDFLAEKVGLQLLPPYLSLVDENGTITNATAFETGVNFASAGSGILNETRLGYNVVQFEFNNLEIERDRPMSMSTQIGLYSTVYEYLVEELGSDAARARLSKSLFLIVVGSNDLFSYDQNQNNVQNQTTPEEYVDLMISTFEPQLKLLYEYGARKYAVAGVPLLGCTPSQRINITGEGCNDELNQWAQMYNSAHRSLLMRMTVELPGFLYSYADTYGITSDIVQTPSSYGITETKAACCGLGPLNGLIPCIPVAALCQNRDEYLFWDPFHPTQKVDQIVVDYIFGGSNFTFPIDIKELIIAGRKKSIGYEYF